MHFDLPTVVEHVQQMAHEWLFYVINKYLRTVLKIFIFRGICL